MQRLTAIVLTCLISFQTIGYLMIQLTRLGEARAAMAYAQKQVDAADAAETIVLTALDFERLNINQKEIRFQGALYDIVARAGNSDGTVTLQVLRDAPEQHVLDEFSAWIGRTRQSAQRPVVAYFAALLTMAFIVPDVPAPLPAPAADQMIACFPFPEYPAAFTPDGLTPPPEAG
jgi:CYTH domain-containing protein